ncbi:MAG: phosphoglucosamine mutase, partial [Actinobacteria bacterium]|nr:phosphoglucosamine mutase [Actinomycetota bacterium]
MTERLFGTDGVRGLAGTELTEDLAYRLGRAAVLVMGRRNQNRPTFVVGRDSRASGEWLEDSLVEGIREAGGDAFIAGVEPTPAIAFLTTDLGASSGVVISASHNPPEYNGVKLFDSDGHKLTDAAEEQIEELLDAPERGGGTIDRVDVATDSYFEHIVERFGSDLSG